MDPPVSSHTITLPPLSPFAAPALRLARANPTLRAPYHIHRTSYRLHHTRYRNHHSQHRHHTVHDIHHTTPYTIPPSPCTVPALHHTTSATARAPLPPPPAARQGFPIPAATRAGALLTSHFMYCKKNVFTLPPCDAAVRPSPCFPSPRPLSPHP